MALTRREFTCRAALLGAGLTMGGCKRIGAGGRDSMHFWLPDEAEPHERTFMQWPANRTVHPDAEFLPDLQHTIADIANSIAEFEPVVMLMDRRHERDARRKLSDAVDIWDIPTDDLWARDSGPCFVRNAAGDLAVRQFNFNGWGGKQVHGHDARVAAAVAELMGLPLLDNGLVGEPGGLEQDGAGTVIAHESSWVNANRNAGNRREIEKLILEAVGGEKLIWAPGLKGQDITDYHIDALARFVAPGKVLIQLPEETETDDDPFAAAAYETYDILQSARTANGRRIELVEIPEPAEPRVEAEDFVASYVNYYVCNGAVIAAQFGDRETDTIARDTLAKLYRNREIMMINVDPLGEVGGGIHCATQQQPKV